MVWRIVRAILILPVSVVVIPALLVMGSEAAGLAVGWVGLAAPVFWLAALLAVAGVALAGWTVRPLFADGPSLSALVDARGRLVVRGPYRHVRNPMVCAGVLLLAAEALMLHAWPVAIWLAVFYMANSIYVMGVEERGLERRLGAGWRRYKAHVPRWFPSPVGYDPDDERRAAQGGRG